MTAKSDVGESTTEDWRAGALCAQTDPEAFFPDKGEAATAAKRTCLSCEVRVPCLEWALENREPHGIWGGLSALQRRHLAQNRRVNGNAPVPEPEEAA